MFYVIRCTFKPGVGHVWGVAYAGTDRPEARATFDLIRLDEVWCTSKALVHQQSTGRAVLDADGAPRPRGDKGGGWLAHALAAFAAIEAHGRGATAQAHVAQDLAGLAGRVELAWGRL
jgi:hypothetical protein